ncbi:MAG: type II secretion system protein [Verrucomicrobiota bacterium]|jgi:prepilin-type N-terminal cleavage/methylation domain-containing protein
MKTVETKTNSRRAFTLIELLAVITIIGVLAAFLVPTIGAVKRHELISKTQAEMAQVETAIERYKAAYGFYPPDSTETLNNVPITQLYYELLGTTNNGGTYQTLDGNAPISAGLVSTAFGANVGGFINCSKTNADESTEQARNFLPDLRQNQIETVTNPPNSGILVTLLSGSVGGSSPLGSNINPWRYNSHNPTNNPGSYDLWIQIVIKPGQTNLICNWSRQPQINSPLP